MRSQKRYSNATFTKRVDHEEGHRSARNIAEPAVCEICGAVYAKRRWCAAEYLPEQARNKHSKASRLTVCPACRQKRDGVPCGFVHLEGVFLVNHRAEIEVLLLNEAHRASRDNPLARILEWQGGVSQRLTVTTTTEHLAQRLGHALRKAFAGDVNFGFSHENKLSHVWWRRD